LRGSTTAETGQSPAIAAAAPGLLLAVAAQTDPVMSCLGWVTALAGRTVLRG
jgi:hypothetical protein